MWSLETYFHVTIGMTQMINETLHAIPIILSAFFELLLAIFEKGLVAP